MSTSRKGAARPCASSSVDGAAKPKSTVRRRAGTYIPKEFDVDPVRVHRYHGPALGRSFFDELFLLDDEGGED